MSDPTGSRALGHQPLVTVAMPVYNGGSLVGRALRDVLAQDYPHLEILVADNASTDGTLELVREMVDGDPRVRVLTSPVNRGASWNFNRLFEAAHGELFKWVAHDDELDPTLVRRCVEELLASPGAVLAYPRTSLIDLDGRVVGDFEDGMDLREPTPQARLRHFLGTRTEYHPVWGVIRREALARTDLLAPYCASDVTMLGQLAMLGQWCEVPERLFHRRFHPGTSILANADYRDRAKWFDPRNEGRPALPMAQVAYHLLVSVRRMPLPAAQRAACARAVLDSWCAPYARVIAGEVRLELTRRVRRAPLAGT